MIYTYYEDRLGFIRAKTVYVIREDYSIEANGKRVLKRGPVVREAFTEDEARRLTRRWNLAVDMP